MSPILDNKLVISATGSLAMRYPVINIQEVL